jgi:hypothetical protein
MHAQEEYPGWYVLGGAGAPKRCSLELDCMHERECGLTTNGEMLHKAR